MIRHALPTGKTLEGLVDEEAPASARSGSWRDRAAAHTARMKRARGYSPAGKPDWGEVKKVYVTIQHFKCAYCEKYLEGPERATGVNVGAVEQDVEHFRPKSSVKQWQPTAGFAFAVKNGTAAGYYMLALDLWNYCASCKTCNSTYKSDRFPIEGRPARKGSAKLSSINAGEQPLLIYPIGALDDDPEDAIGFKGYQPIPRTASGRLHRRAMTTIHFFDLAVRENLIRQRCDVIVSLYNALRASANTADPLAQQDGLTDIARLTSNGSHHASCARSFRDLFLTDPAGAYQEYRKAQALLASL